MLPFAPLEELAKREGWSLNELERRSGINPSRARRFGLRIDTAEHAARRLHYHPLEIWADDYLRESAAL